MAQCPASGTARCVSADTAARTPRGKTNCDPHEVWSHMLSGSIVCSMPFRAGHSSTATTWSKHSCVNDDGLPWRSEHQCPPQHVHSSILNDLLDLGSYSPDVSSHLLAAFGRNCNKHTAQLSMVGGTQLDQCDMKRALDTRKCRVLKVPCAVPTRCTCTPTPSTSSTASQLLALRTCPGSQASPTSERHGSTSASIPTASALFNLTEPHST